MSSPEHEQPHEAYEDHSKLLSDIEGLFTSANILEGTPVAEDLRFVMQLSVDEGASLEQLRIYNWSTKDITKIVRSTREGGAFEGSGHFVEEAEGSVLRYLVSVKDMLGRRVVLPGTDGPLLSGKRVHYDVFDDGLIASWKNPENQQDRIYVDGVHDQTVRSMLERIIRPCLALSEVSAAADDAIFNSFEFPKE